MAGQEHFRSGADIRKIHRKRSAGHKTLPGRPTDHDTKPETLAGQFENERICSDATLGGEPRGEPRIEPFPPLLYAISIQIQW